MGSSGHSPSMMAWVSVTNLPRANSSRAIGSLCDVTDRNMIDQSEAARQTRSVVRTTVVYKQPTRPSKLVVAEVEGVGQQSFVESSSSRTQEEEQ